jgi:hypothetical protein
MPLKIGKYIKYGFEVSPYVLLNIPNVLILCSWLDKKLLKLRLGAEKKCRKLKMGKVLWSPEFALLKTNLKYWCLTHKTLQGKSIDMKFFRRIAKAANLPTQVQQDFDQVQEAIQTQKELIKLYKKKHVTKRETFLEGLAKALAEKEASNSQDKDIKRLHFVKLLHQREQQRLSARTIRNVVSAENNYQQLDHIVFEDEEGNQVVTYDTQTIERQLIEENKRRFNQAAESPFLVQPLVSWVGKFGETVGVDKILDADLGNLETTIDQYSFKVLQEMKRPAPFLHHKVDMSFKAFAKTWSKVKEHTASGKSSLHFGHFMAGCKHSQIGRIECAMANFPLRTGYSPKRWQQGIEVMLLKQKKQFSR